MLRLWTTIHGVPIYVRPPILTVPKKKVKEVHAEYRCLISKNFRWRSRVYSIRVKAPPTDKIYDNYKISLIVITGKAKSKEAKEEVIQKLKELEVKVNPYSIGECFGFYGKSEYDIERVVGKIHPLVEAIAIVNTVLYFDIGKTINIRAVAERGFILPALKSFKDAYGKINGYSVRLFFNGRVGVYGPIPPDKKEISNIINAILWFLKEAKAI